MTIEITRCTRPFRGFRLSTEILLEAPRDRVFEFFSDAFRLEEITPPWLHFSILTEPPIEMRTGALIDYKLRLKCVPIRWQSRISEWHPPFRFVDEQLRGPYRHWHHLHTFKEVADGTLVGDIVHYSVPLGFLMSPLFVDRYLTKIFEYRHQAIRKAFRTGSELEVPTLVAREAS